MQKLIIAFCFICLVTTVSAQRNYKTAVGIKFYPASISAKTFVVENKKAVEGLFTFWDYGFRVTGLYEIYGDIISVDGLKWYVGPGAHVGFLNTSWKDEYPTRDASMQIGIDGVIGLDYKINDMPINISIDWQPSFTLVGYNYFEGGWGGVGLRYTFAY